VRNSLFRHGRCVLGDRHVLELGGSAAELTYVDAKICPNRQFYDVRNSLWRACAADEGGKPPAAVPPPTHYESSWGAPYGAHERAMPSGTALEIELVGTDLSIAYVDDPDGGILRVAVDGRERLRQETDVPFTDQRGEKHFMENRKGVRALPFGMHTVRVAAEGGTVRLLGVFTYDSRPNRHSERRLTGTAAPGQTISVTPPFRARPVVFCAGRLAPAPDGVTRSGVTFAGDGPGTYELIGE
jgi:hypothetical protein